MKPSAITNGGASTDGWIEGPDWWNTLHQPSSVIKLSGPSIHPSMLAPLLVMALGFTLYFAALVMVRMRSEILAARIRAARLAQLGA